MSRHPPHTLLFTKALNSAYFYFYCPRRITFYNLIVEKETLIFICEDDSLTRCVLLKSFDQCLLISLVVKGRGHFQTFCLAPQKIYFYEETGGLKLDLS